MQAKLSGETLFYMLRLQ